jgi:hypothetical protein
MSVEISDIREALKTNLDTLTDSCQKSAYRLPNPVMPALLVTGFDLVERVTFGQPTHSRYSLPFLIQGLAGRATDKGAQIRLDKWLSPLGTAATNVWAAIESDPTLGGIAKDVTVISCDGQQELTLDDGTAALGSTWHVQVDI